MDQEQVEKRIAWLDEQHRKSSDTVKELKGLLRESRNQIEKQSKQIADLSDDISRIAGLTTRIHQVDETLIQHRKEVTRQLERAEKRRTEKEGNLDALRKADLQAVLNRIDQIQKSFKSISEIEHILETRRDEEVRLSKQTAKLDKQMEKSLDKSSSQGDQINSLVRSSDRLMKEQQKINAEVEAQRKKSEESQGMLDVLMDSKRSLDIRISDLVSTESERSEGQSRWVERQELSIVEFENSWKKWSRRFDAIEQQATDFDDRLAAYEEMHRSLKQMRTELGELMERLERRITEVSEMQRLGDNRMKHDWSSFQAEYLKRWNTYKLTSDELWREHNRLHDRLTEDLVSISDDLKQATQSINTMTDADRMRLGELMSMMREWLSEYAERED